MGKRLLLCTNTNPWKKYCPGVKPTVGRIYTFREYVGCPSEPLLTVEEMATAGRFDLNCGGAGCGKAWIMTHFPFPPRWFVFLNDPDVKGLDEGEPTVDAFKAPRPHHVNCRCIIEDISK